MTLGALLLDSEKSIVGGETIYIFYIFYLFNKFLVISKTTFI